jgi:Flp pilus assembly protein TadD
MNLASALAQKGDVGGAIEEGKEAVRLLPKDSEAHRTLGRLLAHAGHGDEASKELQPAVELDGTLPCQKPTPA